MNLNLLFKLFLVLLGFTYISLQAFQEEIAASCVSGAMLVLLTILYRNFSKRHQKQFYLFLVFFTISEIIGCISWFLPIETNTGYDIIYYSGNIFYITAYIFLIRYITDTMDLKQIFKRFLALVLKFFL